MTDKEYREIDVLSYSSLKLFARSPAHYLQGFDGETDSMKTGIMIHTYILENEKFYDMYVKIPDELKEVNKNTKAYQDWKKSNDKEIIDDSDIEMLDAIKNNLNDIKLYGMSLLELIKTSKKEIPMFGTVNGVEMKGKIDVLNDNIHVIIDLKTIDNVNKMRWNARDLKYHWQAYIYQELYIQTYLENANYYVIGIEKTKPYGIKVFQFSCDSITSAEGQVLKTLNNYKDWKNAGSPYIIYGDEVEILEV